MSEKLRFNTGWEFYKTTIGHEPADLADAGWSRVDLPHDWLIGQVSDLYQSSEGWYRNTLSFDGDQSRQLSLCFDGVYMDSVLYLNGHEIGTWKYGYSSFEFPLGSHLKIGENRILLRVRHQAPNSRWYSGAGIYRNVWLRITHPIHFCTNGIYIHTERISEGNWQVTVSGEIELPVYGQTADWKRARITHDLLNHSGELIGTFAAGSVADAGPVHTITGTAITSAAVTSSFTVAAPELWSPGNPRLYTLRSALVIDGTAVDVEYSRFGFRTIELTPDRGLFVNGRPTKLNGVCLHHDLGALGAAFYPDAARRQLKLMQDMGANAVRTAHNMPAPGFLDLADEMGLLIVDEAFDMWERPKTEYDYARFFPACHEQDIASWIRRDRNHPSVIMWSIGNEIYDTHAGERGLELTAALAGLVTDHDPLKNAAITLGSNYMAWENARKCADLIKVAGYNYSEKLYDGHHADHPDWIIYGSETASVVQSRGIYHFPLDCPILSDDDRQCSALGNSTTSWGAKSLEFCALTERNTPYSLGQFIWTGIDYIGEPTPYHTKNSYFGQADTAGLPKDSYYFYQSMWRDFEEFPMIHLLPYWDFNEGQTIDVRIFTNAPETELFINGRSLGCRTLSPSAGGPVIADWKVPYQRGELKAVAYDNHHKPAASAIRRSFGDACRLCLDADRDKITADGESLAFITIYTVDAAGNPVENANNQVEIQVTGAGRLMGLDNGDSTDCDEYRCTRRFLFGGKLLAIIASGLTEGLIDINVTSPGLQPASLQLTATGPKLPPTAAAQFCCRPSNNRPWFQPVRQIELTSPAGQHFNPDCRVMTVTARCLPESAPLQELEWRITSPSGTDLKIAGLEYLDGNKREVRITAFGDGDFILRCSCKNSKAHADIISCLDYRISGIGHICQNPYEFISASLYSCAVGDVTPGNERGIATARDAETIVTFDNLDFGAYGADTITIPVFELDSKATEIAFCEGTDFSVPQAALGSFVYHKQSQWNVYQEETFRFRRRLKGITSFSVKLRHKIHMQGFYFEEIQKAYQTLYAAEADQIYGDTFCHEKDRVTGIGNNVSLIFKDMDFTPQAISRIIICGRCLPDVNTIHIRFKGMEKEINQLAEFRNAPEYTEQVFSLEPVEGLQEISFIFLPGSNFDFYWFRFE